MIGPPTRRRRLPRHRRLLEEMESDPLAGVANLFDAAMVFAVALLFAFVTYAGFSDLLARDADLTVLKNPGRDDMEIIRKRGVKLERYRLTRQTLGGEGVRLGTAYRLRTGEVVYVPEDGR